MTGRALQVQGPPARRAQWVLLLTATADRNIVRMLRPTPRSLLTSPDLFSRQTHPDDRNVVSLSHETGRLTNPRAEDSRRSGLQALPRSRDCGFATHALHHLRVDCGAAHHNHYVPQHGLPRLG